MSKVQTSMSQFFRRSQPAKIHLKKSLTDESSPLLLLLNLLLHPHHPSLSSPTTPFSHPYPHLQLHLPFHPPPPLHQLIFLQLLSRFLLLLLSTTTLLPTIIINNIRIPRISSRKTTFLALASSSTEKNFIDCKYCHDEEEESYK